MKVYLDFLVGGLIAIGAGVTPPCMRSMISKQVDSSEQGKN